MATAPVSGQVRALLTPTGKIKSLSLRSRVTGKDYAPAVKDANSGLFAFENIPGDAWCDLVVQTTDGRRLEGIDLSLDEHRLHRLAAIRRKQLGLPALAPEAPFTARDANEIVRYVDGLEDFMDHRRVIYIRGRAGRATALIEALRTREFHADTGGEVIWRVELWYFARQAGGWDQLAETARVLERRRLPRSQFKTLSVEYFPGLSVYVRPDGTSETVKFNLPAKPDPTRGRVPDGTMKSTSRPEVFFADANAPAPK